ncbi:hypothetical protein QJS10_CPA03g02338 [Acorus calamus]|uniref:Uncharacterized protein n=1 Tax=Acorus calamus TaxID=4465 RepID=A0AAV9F878_ACOCL|nr:hypothetical protein QJS10_CPA03g02338 [Acorus calamus]
MGQIPLTTASAAAAITPSASSSTSAPSLDGGIGNCRFDFRSSCAILSGKIFLSQQQEDSSSSSNAGDSSSASSAITVASVNGHASLDLVPVPNQSLLLKPLTIADLSLAPMHGSCLRVAYQGVPDSYMVVERD